MDSTPIPEQPTEQPEPAGLIPLADLPRVVQHVLRLPRIGSRLSRIDKDSKEARNKRIFDLWLACWTQQEIADEVGISRKEVERSLGQNGELAELSKPDQSAATHATDFKTPLYNIWTQQTKTTGSSHFGNSEVRWLDNLLYLYTSPFDIVIDPFAGGGSTIDICKKRFRR